MKIVGIALLLVGCSGAAFGLCAAPAPEISPVSAVAGLALVSGALLVIRGRRRK